MHILIINLPVAVKRRQFQQQQLQRLSLEHQILAATAAADIDPETYQQRSQDWQRPLKKTELACYLSHRHAWQHIIALNEPALILEDDALLSKRVPQLLATLKNTRNADYINLEVRGRKKFVARHGENIGCDTQLYRLYQDRTGAAGYILWPSGAEKLLQHEKENGIAIADAHITSCHQLIAYQVEPAAIIQLDQCSTYGINIKGMDELSSTTVSSATNDKGGPRFWFKRLSAQVILGLRQLFLLTKTVRRHITINTRDF